MSSGIQSLNSPAISTCFDSGAKYLYTTFLARGALFLEGLTTSFAFVFTGAGFADTTLTGTGFADTASAGADFAGADFADTAFVIEGFLSFLILEVAVLAIISSFIYKLQFIKISKNSFLKGDILDLSYLVGSLFLIRNLFLAFFLLNSTTIPQLCVIKNLK
jgi:hypothetical protein